MEKKPMLLMSISVLLFVLVIFGTLFICWIIQGPKQESSRSLETYGEWSLPEKYSTLLIFPETVPNSATDISYYYKFQEGWNRPICQLFLACTLAEGDFVSEKQRLSEIAISSEAGTDRVKYDENAFLYPAYVAIEGYDFCYEYALLNEEDRQIFYVYAMNTIYRDVKFDRKYLPDYYMENFENFEVDGLDRFTIYGK